MTTRRWLRYPPLAAVVVLCACTAEAPRPAARAGNSVTVSAPVKAAAVELSTADFYKMPIGAYGLEPTPKLLSLDGQRVRIQGYMVREEEPVAGLFLLTPVQVSLAERADGPADDLPAATVFVHLPREQAGRVADHLRGVIAIEGQLELGALEEPNDRISYVRLRMDALEIGRPATAGVH